MMKTWTGSIAKVNTPTADGRKLTLDGGAVPSRELPLPLAAWSGNSILQVGLVQEIHRDGDDVTAQGLIDTELLTFVSTPHPDHRAVPIAITIEESDNASGWRIVRAWIEHSVWPGVTIKIN